MDVLRAFTLLSVVFLNCFTLYRLCFRSAVLCLHTMLAMAVVLANILYMLTTTSILLTCQISWWTLMSEQVYCLSQNYMVNAMSMVLLGLLAVRAVEKTRQIIFIRSYKLINSPRNMCLIFVVWIFPQLAYDLISLTGSRRLCQNPVFHVFAIAEDLSAELMGNGSSKSAGSSAFGNILCEEDLTAVTMSVYTWQYIFLVLPLAIISAICAIIIVGASLFRPRKHTSLVRYSPWMTHAHYTEFQYGEEVICQKQRCEEKLSVVSVVLALNCLWQLLGRPLLITRSIMNHPSSALTPPTFLDIGSHLMLTISCIFIPLFWLSKDLNLNSSSSSSNSKNSRCVALTSPLPIDIQSIDCKIEKQ